MPRSAGSPSGVATRGACPEKARLLLAAPGMMLDLSMDEGRLLATHLQRYLKHVDAELVRTDKYELQHALAREERTLEGILDRLRESLARASSDTVQPRQS